jgi:hypothetical protein
MLKQHLDMIGRNEPIQRKAKFWQSYVRALKGTSTYFIFNTIIFRVNYIDRYITLWMYRIVKNGKKFKKKKKANFIPVCLHTPTYRLIRVVNKLFLVITVDCKITNKQQTVKIYHRRVESRMNRLWVLHWTQFLSREYHMQWSFWSLTVFMSPKQLLDEF